MTCRSHRSVTGGDLAERDVKSLCFCVSDGACYLLVVSHCWASALAQREAVDIAICSPCHPPASRFVRRPARRPVAARPLGAPGRAPAARPRLALGPGPRVCSIYSFELINKVTIVPAAPLALAYVYTRQTAHPESLSDTAPSSWAGGGASLLRGVPGPMPGPHVGDCARAEPDGKIRTT